MGNPSPISEAVSVNTPLSAALVQNADQAVPIAVPPTASSTKQRGYDLDGWRSIPTAVTIPIRRFTDMDIEVQHMHFQPPAVPDGKAAAIPEAEPMVEDDLVDDELVDEDDDDDDDPPILDGKHFTFHKPAEAAPVDSTRSVMTITTVASTTAAVSTAVTNPTTPPTAEATPAEVAVISEAAAPTEQAPAAAAAAPVVAAIPDERAARIAAYALTCQNPPGCAPDDTRRWKIVHCRSVDVDTSWSDPEYDEEIHRYSCRTGRNGQFYKTQVMRDDDTDDNSSHESSHDLWEGGNKKKRQKNQRQAQNRRQPRRR